MTAPARVLLAGYFGAGNLGDEAILAAILARLRGALGGACEPTVAAYDREWIRTFHGDIDTVDVWDVRALAGTVARSDLVIWGGGGLVQDHWYVPIEDLLLDARGGVPAHLRVPLLAVLKGVPCMMYGQGVGPLSHAESRRATALVCSSLAAITVRDAASAELLRDCGVRGPEIAVTADPALATVPAAEAVGLALLRGAGLDPQRRPLVAVAPRVPPDGSRAWVAPLLAALRRGVLDRGGSVAFVAFDHRPEGDEALCLELASSLGGGAAALAAALQPADCAAVLGACDAVLATRLHGMVLAAVAGTPTVALDYDPKVPAFAARLDGAVPVVPLAGLDGAHLAAVLGETLAEGPARGARIRAATAGLRVREDLNLRVALGLLRRDGRAAAPVTAGTGTAGRGDEGGDHAAAGELPPSARERALAAEGAELRRQLDMLRGSRVVRLVESYWRWTSAERGGRSGLGRLVGAAHRLILARGTDAPAVGSPAAAESPGHAAEGDAPPSTTAGPQPARGPESPSPPPVAAAPAPAAAPDPWRELPGFEGAMRAAPAPGVAVVLSTTKLVESEGQRSMQLALALARRRFAVVFAYWRWSVDDWCAQDRLAEGIYQVPLDALTAAPGEVLERFGWCPRRLLLVEFPHASFLPVAALAAAHRWTTIYEVVDDWAEFHRVGQAIWYEEAVERELLARASLVTAVTRGLERRLGELGAEQVLLVPNGLRPEIARVGSPVRLDRGEVTVGYFGYLAGAWFDWGLLLAAARARPTWRFYVIGYGGEPEGGAPPDNLVLLGKQSQSSLAAFAASWDVAIVPFKAETLAAGADPIKTYEYLAMGLPVVVTGVFPPAGAEPFVARVEGLEAFLAAIEAAARRPAAEAAARRAWAAAHTWDARLDSLLGALSRAHRPD